MHRFVQAAVAGELGDLERVQRVRKLRGGGERQPCGFDQAPRVVVDAGAVAPLQVRPRQSLGRILGMEEEGKPVDLRAEPALEPLGPREADVAERSGVVAPDRNG